MAENGDWVLLPLYPVDQSSKLPMTSRYDSLLGTKPKFILFPVLVNFRELLLYLFVRYLLADARVHFVQYLDRDGCYL